MLNLDQLVELARDVELTDPIDWSNLNISEEYAYRLIASGILDYYAGMQDDQERLQLLLISVVKLTVENFVLNIKLLSNRD